MLKQSAAAISQWKGFDEAIDRWLDERHELIVLLSKFAENHDFKGADEKTIGQVQAFTTLLIDYISAGHFEFYNRLIEEGQEYNDASAVAAAPALLEAIDTSTQAALDFNEKYQSPQSLEDLAGDLSDLAEKLVDRFDAEDQLIQTLHGNHIAEDQTGA